jgi:ABC-2 type transport system permease protein
MRKLLVIVKREYVARVRTKAFVVMTILMPLLVVASGVLPGLLFSMKTGGATRLAVVDETGRLYEPVRESLLTTREEDEEEGGSKASAQMPTRGMPDANNDEQMRRVGKAMGQRFEIEEVKTEGRSIEEIERGLDERVRQSQLDGYIILPANVMSPEGKAQYRARNLGDVITTSQIKHSLNRTVVEQRMRDANIDRNRVRELSKDVSLETFKVGKSGVEKDTGGGSFGLAFGVGLFVYMGILLYGQMILSSVVEEKTTRISEVLFSSVKPFQLMAGKLVGTSLVGLTQLAIWALVFFGFTAYGVGMMARSGMNISLPAVPLSFFLYAFLFYIVGFFMYGTIYLIVGSMVTTEKEAGQMALPVIFLAVASIWLSFPVIRSPNSPLSFWVSIAPFLSPVTMLVRIVTETPPVWQIALSLAVGVATVLLLTWVAARIYRVGMLMYGKSANIPEVLRWVRQS